MGDEGKVHSLITDGAKVNSANKMNGWTALHWASYRGHRYGWTALYWASYSLIEVTGTQDYKSDQILI